MTSDRRAHAREIARRCAAYKGAHRGRSALQLGGNLLALAAIYALALTAATHGPGWALPPLWFLGGVMLARLFIIQHDCGHGSFWPTRRGNTLIGRLVSVLTFTPYAFWRYTHNRHHATSGDLDRGGIGDVFTASVEQYRAMTPRDQERYRKFRRPVFLMGIGTPLVFLLRYRTPFFQRVPPAKCWRSIIALDLALIITYGAAIALWGARPVLLTVLPTLVVTAWIGGWMFFMQHQFERGHWRRHDDWDWYEASLYGSSYYALPPWLHWCTGHIGLHHIHHLQSGIPNYRLHACLEAIPELRDINPITLRESLACAHLALWHDTGERMISFAEAERAGLI